MTWTRGIARSWRRIVAALAVAAGLYWALAELTPPALQTLDVATLSDRLVLGPSLQVFEDESAEVGLAQLQGAAGARRFQANARREPSLGLSGSAFWARFTVTNRGTAPVRWFLVVDEPTLDDVRLYTVHDDGGVVARLTGDLLPLSSRDVESEDFVFDLTMSPGETVTHYVRIASSGAVRLALAASAPAAYEARRQLHAAAFLLFLGALLVLIAYYLCVFVAVAFPEHIYMALILTAIGVVQASLTGYVARFVFPDHPRVSDRVFPVAIALAIVSITLYARAGLRWIPSGAAVAVYATGAIWGAFALLGVALLGPTGLSLRSLFVVLLGACLLGPLLLRVFYSHGEPQLQLWRHRLCWAALLISVAITVLRYVGILPPHPLFPLALGSGVMFFGVMMQVALAAWSTGLREQLATVNTTLSDNVSNLQSALARAKEAGERAERATMAKDDFMATMSHELRTPLNAIINIPQGMISDFETVRSARCGKCMAEYLLEEGDEIDAETQCEECRERGTLRLGTKVLFQGDPARCLHFLKKIERSGHHLLQMVNGVLDYSKMEAGRFQLSLEEADIEALCREVVDQMSELAAARNIELVLTTLRKPSEMTFDPLRIKQVIINLLSNAIKFSEPNSVVGIELNRDGEVALIEVQDSGIGIAKEHYERIFAGFEQVHKGDTRKYGGTGLGLSISRSLVRMHGGELSVRSELGKGSTFIVRLPPRPKLGTNTSLVELHALAEAAANDVATQRKELG